MTTIVQADKTTRRLIDMKAASERLGFPGEPSIGSPIGPDSKV